MSFTVIPRSEQRYVFPDTVAGETMKTVVNLPEMCDFSVSRIKDLSYALSGNPNIFISGFIDHCRPCKHVFGIADTTFVNFIAKPNECQMFDGIAIPLGLHASHGMFHAMRVVLEDNYCERRDRIAVQVQFFEDSPWTSVNTGGTMTGAVKFIRKIRLG